MCPYCELHFNNVHLSVFTKHLNDFHPGKTDEQETVEDLHMDHQNEIDNETQVDIDSNNNCTVEDHFNVQEQDHPRSNKVRKLKTLKDLESLDARDSSDSTDDNDDDVNLDESFNKEITKEYYLRSMDKMLDKQINALNQFDNNLHNDAPDLYNTNIDDDFVVEEEVIVDNIEEAVEEAMYGIIYNADASR
jgi:hypothetical protein